MSSSSTSSNSSSSSDDVAMLYQHLQSGYQFLQQMEEKRKKKKEAQQAKRSRQVHYKQYIDRDRAGGARQLMNDYFAEHPVYNAAIFRRRFRMSKQLFLQIVEVLETHDPYFQQRPDATGKEGFTTIQKCTAALRQLGQGGAADHLDEYLRMTETMAIEALKRFCRSIVQIFRGRYLRKPSPSDCARVLKMHERRHGFLGMLGSIDCMHWAWRQCPKAWKAQYTRGDKGHPTIILEAVASYDLWIWHAFFGVTGSNNDINIFYQSDIFSDVVNGVVPPINFTANSRAYNLGYFLADGIYPKWPTFIASPTAAVDPKVMHFKVKQEATRKDVERAFGVLQMRWGIIQGPSRLYFRDTMQDVMYACIILHNMIIEDEGASATDWAPLGDEGSSSQRRRNAAAQRGAPDSFRDYVVRTCSLRDSNRHGQLIGDLIEELWARRSA